MAEELYFSSFHFFNICPLCDYYYSEYLRFVTFRWKVFNKASQRYKKFVAFIGYFSIELHIKYKWFVGQIKLYSGLISYGLGNTS